MPPWSSFLKDKDDSPEEIQTKSDFRWYARALERYGVYAGTAHKRILVPKVDITREELEEQLGFVSTKIAIPEQGQKSLSSYRNPYSKYHLHEYEKYWSMHRDEYESSTMISYREKLAGRGGPLSSVRHTVEGAPHLFTEGVPGLGFYLKGVLTNTEPMDVRLLRELPKRYLNKIQGLQAGGLSASTREDGTDFGNDGYKTDDVSHEYLAALMAGGAGYIGTRALFGVRQAVDRTKYPMLAEMQDIGRKYGFKVWHPTLPYHLRKAKSPKYMALYGGLDVTYSVRDLTGFKGLIYPESYGGIKKLGRAIEKGQVPGRVLGLGAPAVGRDKWLTFLYMGKQGLEEHHPLTIGAEYFEDLVEGGKYSIDEFTRQFGGSQNVILKKKMSALSEGVWVGLQNVPEDIMEELAQRPEDFLFQEKLALQKEFRVVTVGGKAVYSAHRWGGEDVQSILGKLGKVSPEAEKYIKEKHLVENIVPVLGKEKMGLESFVETIAKKFPYEIGAFDIGLTKEGVFQVIEAQRSFGSFRNPIVNQRIVNIITGKTSMYGKIAAAGMGLVGAGIAYNLFSARDDEYNTIEGMRHGGMAGELRRENTDFGSGYQGFLPKSLQGLVEHIGGFTGTALEHGVLLNKAINTSGLSFLKRLSLKKDVAKFLISANKSKYFSFVNPQGIKKLASTLEGKYSYEELLEGTIRHESFHKRVLKGKMRESLASLYTSVPKEFVEFYKTNKLGKDIPGMITEEYFAYALSFPKHNRPDVFRTASEIMKGGTSPYNTIEGLPHGGLSDEMRKLFSDFGSPWKGLFGGISRKISKYMAKGAREGAEALLHPAEAARLAKGKTLEEFAVALGGDIRILGKTEYKGTAEDILRKRIFEETAIKQGAGAGFIPGGPVYIHPETLRQRAIAKAKQMGIDEGLVREVVNREEFEKTMLYHEFLEKQSFERFGGKMIMSGKSAKHQAGQVILGEAGFVAQIEDERVRSFFTKLRKTKVEEATFSAGLEAFQETGVNPKLRKLISDFGGVNNSENVARSNIMRNKLRLSSTSVNLKKAQYMIWNNAKHAGRNHIFRQR